MNSEYSAIVLKLRYYYNIPMLNKSSKSMLHRVKCHISAAAIGQPLVNISVNKNLSAKNACLC